MSYPSDGRNHHQSIQVEKSMSSYKSEYEKYYGKNIEKFIHVGGTRNTIDFKILFSDGSEITKSLKKKNNIKNGSFDLINTSDFPSELISNSSVIYEEFHGMKDKSKRSLLIDGISYDLLNMDKNILANIIKGKVINKYENIGGLDIVETSTKKLFINVVPPFFQVLKDGGYFKVQDNGKKQMSYKLDLYNSNDELLPETGLRIRLHLNNGWAKWYNGENTVLVIKIQQDKVSKMLQI
jgi:hypothetical protein